MKMPGEHAGANRSFWERTAPKFSTAPLQQNVTADICVIGAGIAGVTMAYLAAREKRQVILIDDGPVGGGMTGRTTGHLVNAIDDRYLDLEKFLGEEWRASDSREPQCGYRSRGTNCSRAQYRLRF